MPLAGCPRAIAGDLKTGAVIAYVSPSRDNQQIHLIDVLGANDRVLWRVPPETHREDGIGTLSWRPDGTELTFDSSHDALRSMAVRDLYSITTDGGTIRRLTNGPDTGALSAYPQGKVTVQVYNPAFGQWHSLKKKGHSLKGVQ